ncbi:MULTISPECIES: DUF2336 domain-containing protein [Kordiimonas]|uniref:DUF2336 domain-containing protein n=1 Tax=Kordiimonas TaxID=288021 RepID=UPI00257A115E|nr:DUF2336 domain-containing protein [Kordiimonas sp. UBA4487]
MSEKRDTQKNLTASDCISSLAVEERIALARKAGEQLAPELRNKDKYLAAQRVAEALVSDLCLEVRETLAFELRKYKKLPKSIAVKIACDVDEIAVPFLRVTPALSDALMAELIPLLSDNAHLALAVRSDLGIKASRQLICHANDNAALTVICNPSVAIDTSLASLLLDHFGNNRRVIEAVVGRPNLALSVVTHILQQVSDDFQRQLCDTYGIEAQISKSAAINSQHETIWRRIRHAAPGQIHAHVIDLRQAGKLTPDLMLGMADRGCLAFLESTLAVLSSRTLTDVRETLHLANPKQFRALMQDCDLDVPQAQAVQKLARRHYGAARGRREVGNPALWHSRPAARVLPQSAA